MCGDGYGASGQEDAVRTESARRFVLPRHWLDHAHCRVRHPPIQRQALASKAA